MQQHSLAADHLVAVVLLRKELHGGLDDPAPQPQHQVEGRLLLDVVVRKGAAILELLASKDESLLVRGDALLVLDLGLHILDSVAGLDLGGDSEIGKRYKNGGSDTNITACVLVVRLTSRVMVLPVRVFTNICISMCLSGMKIQHAEELKNEKRVSRHTRQTHRHTCYYVRD